MAPVAAGGHALQYPQRQVAQQFEGSAPVTVEGLLSHAAGLPRETDQPYWSAPDFPFPTREEIVESRDGGPDLLAKVEQEQAE